MTNPASFKYGVTAGLAVSVLSALTNGCSAANAVQAAAEGCNGLSASSSQAQAAILAWVTALNDLNTEAKKVEGDWLHVCNEMNGALGLDTSKTTASDACAVLSGYLQTDAQKGVTVVVTVTPDCQLDVSAEASCEATAKCQVTPVTCTGGDVVVGCNGPCGAECDVTAPSFMCSGTCRGECTASAAVMCSGTCTGTCDAPTWTGTCDAGCSAMFSGSCGGKCTGTCDGSGAMGTTCSGTCEGTCDAKASGSCSAACTGSFSGGQCSGMCTGKCNAAAGASCDGTCDGTCSYTPGSATCTGTCHGSCSVTTTPPSCTGSLDCAAEAECQGQATANISCPPPQVTISVVGDATLAATYDQYATDIGNAINETLAIHDPVTALAADTAATFEAIGDVGIGGAACVESQASLASNVQASVTVSFTASATVSGGGG